MKIFKITGLLLLLLLIVIICLEIFFRIKFKEELKDQFSPLIYKADSTYGYIFIPNSTGEISKPGISRKSVKINSKGYYTQEFKVNKEQGYFRIVLVGTSFASGIWMEGQENYSTKLQANFNRNKQKVEIVNCSVDGQGRGYGNLELIQQKLLNLDPDLILLEFDFPVSFGTMKRETYRGYLLQYYTAKTKQLSKNAIDELEDMHVFKFLYDNFYVFRAVCKEIEKKDLSTRRAKLIKTYRDKISRIEEIDLSVFTFRKSIELLRETNEKVLKSGHKMALLVYTDQNPELLKLLKDNGINTISLGCEFTENNISVPDSHLNESGHVIVEKALNSQLSKIISGQDSIGKK